MRANYLVSVMEAASRRVLGFTLSEHHDAAAAYGALAMAVTMRGGQVPGVIMHTDQGSEYTARAFQAACQRVGIAQSMGRPGSALDNAVIESWHSTLEFELRRVEHFATRDQARTAVAAWIESYHARPGTRPARRCRQRLTSNCWQPERRQPDHDPASPARQYPPVLGGIQVVPPRA